MDFRVDQKGKYYTTRVTKETVTVTARLQDTIVHGTLHLAPDNRLKDEMNSAETFVAVTHAQVFALTGERPLYTTEILIVNKSQIVWIFPHDSSTPEPAPAA